MRSRGQVVNNTGYQRMKELISGLPEQLNTAWEIASGVPFSSKSAIDQVIVGAMGGSAMGADIVRSILEAEGERWLTVVRDYSLPAGISDQTLVLAISYSGNTEETIAVYDAAVKQQAKVVVITSGGKLAEKARQDGVPLILIPGGMPPRCAIGLMSVAILVVLNRLGCCRSFLSDIRETGRLVRMNLPVWHRWAVRLSRKIVDRFIIVYSTSRLLDTAAYRLQCQLNENAKMLAHWGTLPEASHNEIMGFGAPVFLDGKVAVIALVDPTSHLRTLVRLGQMLKLIQGTIAENVRLESAGRSGCARLFSQVVRGDLLSIELARRRNVDPMVIPKIDRLKLVLTQKR